MVIFENFNKEALSATTPIFWVWPSYNQSHTLKDQNIINMFNAGIV